MANDRVEFLEQQSDYAFHGKFGKLKKLMKNRPAFINKQNVFKDTPLNVTAYKGQLECAIWLLENGADVELTNNYKMNIFMIAAYLDHSDYLESLLSGERINMINDKSADGKTALIYAAMNDSVASVNVLLNKNADTLIEDDTGRSALGYACGNQNIALVETLMRISGEIGK